MIREIPRLPIDPKPREPESIFTPAEAELAPSFISRCGGVNPEGQHHLVPRERATFHLPVDLLEEVRDAVAAVPGLTMASCAEHALRTFLHLLRREYNGEMRFPHRTSPIKRGRPRRDRT